MLACDGVFAHLMYVKFTVPLVKSSQVKFIYLTIRKNTQEGHSEKTTRSSRSTAPLWQYFYTYGGKLNLKK